VILGSASGRLSGELLTLAFPSLNISAGGYAVVGAAAFSAGVTRTVASGIIVFELTGQMTHLLPVLMTVLIAASVGNFFTASVYDTLLREKGLPYIPAIKNSKLMKKTVGYVMNSDLKLISTEMTYNQLQSLLKHSEETVYPLVNTLNEKIFLCQIQRFALERHLFKHELAFRKSKKDTDSEEDTSDEEEHELATNLKKIHISIDDDLQKRKQRRKQEKREKRRRIAKKKEQEQREKEILRQNVQQHILQLKSAPSGTLPSPLPSSEDPSGTPLNLSPQQIAQASTSPQVLLELSESITDSIIQSKKLKKPQQRIISREEFFDQSCGFDKLAIYLASHGVSKVEETIIPTVDGSKPTEAEGDNTGVDLCPYTVLETSPLSKVHFMFAVMGLSHIWVVREGRLVGLVAKEDLMNMEKE